MRWSCSPVRVLQLRRHRVVLHVEETPVGRVYCPQSYSHSMVFLALIAKAKEWIGNQPSRKAVAAVKRNISADAHVERARCSPRIARAPSPWQPKHQRDRKSTRLNSSHVAISYAVFCF